MADAILRCRRCSLIVRVLGPHRFNAFAGGDVCPGCGGRGTMLFLARGEVADWPADAVQPPSQTTIQTQSV